MFRAVSHSRNRSHPSTRTGNQREQSLYVGIVGGVSLVVGSFPVGMGWYPAWVALLLSVAVFAAMFLLLGTRTDTLGDNAKAGRAGGSQWGASHRTDGLSLNNP